MCGPVDSDSLLPINKCPAANRPSAFLVYVQVQANTQELGIAQTKLHTFTHDKTYTYTRAHPPSTHSRIHTSGAGCPSVVDADGVN